MARPVARGGLKIMGAKWRREGSGHASVYLMGREANWQPSFQKRKQARSSLGKLVTCL